MEKPNPLYNWALKAWAPLRWVVGLLLIAGGIFGFLPVLGFWMVPLGVLFLASGSPRVRVLTKAFIRKVRHWLGRDGAADRARRRNHEASNSNNSR